MKRFFTFLLIISSFYWGIAQTTTFTVTIDGAQASMGNGTGSNGTGTATISYDHTTNEISVNGSFEGLTGSASVAHIHQAPAGQNGDIAVDLVLSNDPPNGMSGTFVHSTTPNDDRNNILTEEEEQALLADGMYINIHSSAAGGGEIRGQIITQTTTFTSTIDGAQAIPGGDSDSPGTGSATLSYDHPTQALTVNGSFSGLEGEAGPAHIHQQNPGSMTGDVKVTLILNNDPGGKSGTFTANTASNNNILNSTEEEALFNEEMYINIHSSTVGSGEIRGQVLLANAQPALAIQLGKFTGHLLKDNTVLLSWEAITDFPDEYFIIERAVAGGDFHKIGRIEATANENQLAKYAYHDIDTPSGINLYRLQSVSNDDKKSYSPIITIHNQNQSLNWRVYPNPAQEEIFVNIPNIQLEENLTIRLFNQLGELSRVYYPTQTQGEIRLPITDLATGTYFLMVDDYQIQKITIQ